VTPEGRFDLAAPEGTCCLGETEGAAVREKVGRYLAAHLPIPPEGYEGRAVSRIASLKADGPIADLTSPRAAAQGVTGEIHTIGDYDLTVTWATAIRREAFGGIRYQPRFTPGQEAAVAMFGPAGSHPGRGTLERTRPLTAALDDLGYDFSRSQKPSTSALGERAEDEVEPEEADD
jgi:hypothetical protein